MRILSWLRIVPSAFAGWIPGFFIGYIILEVGRAMCPYEVSGWKGCFHPQFLQIEALALIVGGTISGFLFVLFPSFLAPAYHRTVALTAMVLELGIAIHLNSKWTTEVVPLALGAIVAMWLVHRIYNKRFDRIRQQ